MLLVVHHVLHKTLFLDTVWMEIKKKKVFTTVSKNDYFQNPDTVIRRFVIVLLSRSLELH